MRRMIEEYGGVILAIIATLLMLMMLPVFASKATNAAALVTNTIENTDPSTPGPIIVSLSIDGKIYDYEEGMSWNEWINSSYNTDNYTAYTNPCDTIDYLGKYTVTQH